MEPLSAIQNNDSHYSPRKFSICLMNKILIGKKKGIWRLLNNKKGKKSTGAGYFLDGGDQELSQQRTASRLGATPF
jgi:hypothetical protein